MIFTVQFASSTEINSAFNVFIMNGTSFEAEQLSNSKLCLTKLGCFKAGVWLILTAC